MKNFKDPLNFNFHGIVAAQVYTTSPRVATFYEAEYKYHQVDNLKPNIPRVILHFEYKPGWIPCPSGYIRYMHKALAHWVYRIEFAEDQIKIDVYGNQWAILMVHHMLLHPALRYLACIQGALLLHGGAVANHGYSLVFSGHGGSGKTITTSLILESGGKDWDVHGDDYVFLYPGASTMAYITQSHLYRDLLNFVPGVKSRLTQSERFRLEIYGRIRYWSDDQIKWPIRIPINRLWPDHKIAMEVKPAALVVLEKNNLDDLKITKIKPNEVPVSRLIDMNFGEARHFLSMVRKSQVVPNFTTWLKDWKIMEQTLLQQHVNKVPVYLMLRPRVMVSMPTFKETLMEKMIDLIPQDSMDYEAKFL